VAVRGLTRPSVASIAAGLLLAGVVTLATSAFVFHLAGGHWFVVTTSSMGRAAPVGTLVLTEPTRASPGVPDVRVGDVVSFRPPTVPGTVYTHRVASIGTDGIRTSGDTTGSIDPWLLDPDDLVGRAVALVPGVGRLLTALPWLAGGALVVWQLGLRIVLPDHRAAFRVLASCLLVSVVVAVHRPFVGVDLLSTTLDEERGGARVHVVSTGLAPVRAQVDGGGDVDLVSGAVGAIRLPQTSGRVDVVTSLHLPPLGWIVVALICALPILWTLTVGLPARPTGRPGAAGSDDHQEAR
jgi:hypothetical protein